MRLEQLLGIDLPIIQAPMAGVQDSGLAIAVSRAGALGSLPCAMLGPDALAQELAAIRSQVAGPVNVNFFCHTPPQPDPARESRWREALAPYFQEMGLDLEAIVPGAGRRPFAVESAEVLADFEPEVVSFHFGLPPPELLARVRAWGAKVIASATTLDEALWLEARGVDAVIAQGIEAGGHRGHFLSADPALQPALQTLLAQVIPRVKVPVIAAGGIADAEAVAAALAQGAAGVQVGTAYLLCPEATTSAVHRAALRSETALASVLTNVFTGGLARGIPNRLIRELGPISRLAPAFPLAAAALGPLRAQAERQGSGDFSPLWAGQNWMACREITAGQLTGELAAGARGA